MTAQYSEPCIPCRTFPYYALYSRKGTSFPQGNPLQSMWPRGRVSAMISTQHDKDWRSPRCRARFSSTGGRCSTYVDLLRTNFSDQSPKRLEGTEWSRCVHRGQIVRGVGADHDAERARRIAPRRESPLFDDHAPRTSDGFAEGGARGGPGCGSVPPRGRG